ncbi:MULTISPECIES: UDP-3-O-(3-hydroxymyristoyl)glucosamine N-acyltransferase [Actibacterium]|uniref:UDP-3-O-acylglucosamine N-acyltransferase n=1 Tax=Actibacterium naphthalenivorans TaxID=1614693 RepID=A0A840CFQ1_9RHOB|nr:MULTISPECIES: UDP-3-O-(3-hydroxymyristoyl)glucosamine N-acyltransferase [Actibacterium]ALG90206.1 UDP-3-O-(3-hydroxymyristoyl) glucosamine N-acyltransferase [Actibacterium sp. EMB200-NS6]MBB4022099.1 UDP-3-O-[3-hydroxymyristoyl] glucosamine N-acyltransferase [Actibacterium naphthalenivorans]
MSYTIREIADALGARTEGDDTLPVTGVAEPAEAATSDLALAMAPKYAEGLAKGQARAAVLWDGADWRALGLAAAIFVPRPRYALSGLTRMLDKGPEIAAGIHPSAVIDPSAQIGAGAAIGPFVVIGARARLGAGARIASHVSIAEDAVLGADALLMQGVRIGARVKIGDRFIAQPGAVIGADGLSFVTPEKSTVETVRENLGQVAQAARQSWTRIHSLGSVQIGDDVEVGANAAFDRGTIRNTRIGNGCKIDNLVHLAHNVVVGEDCLFAAQVGIAGSTTVGDRVVFGGQVGVSDNLTIGSDVVAGGATKILSNVPSGRALLGYPAMKMESQVQAYKDLRRLPRLFAQVAELQKAVSKPEQKD